MKKIISFNICWFYIPLILTFFGSACNSDKKEKGDYKDSMEIKDSIPIENNTPMTRDSLLRVKTETPPPKVFIPPTISDPDIVDERPPEIQDRYITATVGGQDDDQIIASPFYEPEIYTAAEQMPEFIGGYEALVIYLKDNIQYPPKAAEEQIEGRVNVKFVVNQQGAIKDINVVKSSGNADMDKEAIRVVKSMPNWKPGKQNGKPVSVYFTVPIYFRLE